MESGDSDSTETSDGCRLLLSLNSWSPRTHQGLGFAKDCLLTLVKGRLALGSPGCSFVRDHVENGPIHRKIVFDCPLVIISKAKLLDQTASLLHS